jgi:PP-loop superfamily ATP-utilizing enzyme
MREQHTRRTNTAASMYGAKSGLPTTGYAVVADGQIKSEFNTHDPALQAARDLKGRFPKLQVKVYDAEKKHSEKIEVAAA